MITLPIVLTYRDISVFPDTDDCNLYYCLRTTPHVRLNDNGQPVFRAVFWSGSKATDETVKGFLGGKVNFDTDLSITSSEEDVIKDLIKSRGIQQKRYNEIVAREKKRENLLSAVTGPSELQGTFDKQTHRNEGVKKPMNEFLKVEVDAARTGIPVVGEVSFGSLIFTSGSVDVFEQKGGSLVEWSNGGGKPAMFGDNNSATVLQLTPMGAGVFYTGITERTKAISIGYDLKLQMAMPALDIRIYAGSIQKEQASSLARHFDRGCKSDVDVKKITQLMDDLGMIHIFIENKSTDIDDETIGKIRDSMMSILNKKVEEIINTKIMPLTTEERESKTSLIIEEEFRSFTELTFHQSSVFEFNIAPNATICEFFENVTDDQMKKIVTVMDMTNNVFSFKEITLCAIAPWNEKPFVNLVKVECEYPSLPQGNENRIRSFSFDKDNPTASWSFMKPKDDNDTIRYTPYVYINGVTDSVKLPTQTAKGNYIVVSVGKIGIIDISLRAHPNVTSLPGDLKVSSILFELWYDDAKGNRLMGPEQILVSDLENEVKFERNLGVVIDQPLMYKITYFFKNIDPIPLPEKKFYLGDDGVSTIFAEFPFKNRKTLQVTLPTDPADIVKSINGEIYYGKYVFPFSLTKEDEWESVKVNLCTVDETIKDFTYSVNLRYENAEFDMVKSGVLKGDIDAASLILPLKRIEMAGIDMLNLGEKYYRANVQINLPTDAGNPIEFHLSKKDKELESKIFYVFCPDNVKFEISWSLTLIDMESQQLPTVKGKTDKTFFILTPPKTK